MKTESSEIVCREAQSSQADNGGCPTDMTLCSPATIAAAGINRPPSAPLTCYDTAGKWAKKRCNKKQSKGKCHKKKVRSNCRKTCGLCMRFTGTVPPPPPPPP